MVFSVICIAVICTLLAEFGFLLLLRSSWYWRAFGTAMYNCIPCGIVMCISYHSSLLVSKLPIAFFNVLNEQPKYTYATILLMERGKEQLSLPSPIPFALSQFRHSCLIINFIFLVVNIIGKSYFYQIRPKMF